MAGRKLRAQTEEREREGVGGSLNMQTERSLMFCNSCYNHNVSYRKHYQNEGLCVSMKIKLVRFCTEGDGRTIILSNTAL